MNNRTRSSALYITRGALIAAIYVVITYITSLMGLDKGIIQFRLSEALCILPVFLLEAAVGLSIGCLLANLLTGSLLWDIIFGSLATFIGALGARALRRLPMKLCWLIPLPNVIANAIAVPLIIIYAYGASGAYPYILLTVLLGELVCSLGGGIVLYRMIKRRFYKIQ